MAIPRKTTEQRDQIIYDLIMNQGMNGAEVGRKLGVSREAVRLARKRLGLDAPRKLVIERNMDIIKSACMGKNVDQIMSEITVKRNTVTALSNKFNHIIQLHKDDTSPQDISKQLGVRLDFVNFCIAEHKKTGVEKISHPHARPTKRHSQRVKRNAERNREIALLCEKKSVIEVANMFKLSEASIRRAQLENGSSPNDPLKSDNAGLYLEVYARHVLDDEAAPLIKKELSLSESRFRYAVRTGKSIVMRHPDII